MIVFILVYYKSIIHYLKILNQMCSSIQDLFGFHTGASVVKNPPANAETPEVQVQCLGQEDPLKEEMATHSRILAWRIPQSEQLVVTVHEVAKSRT